MWFKFVFCSKPMKTFQAIKITTVLFLIIMLIAFHCRIMPISIQIESSRIFFPTGIFLDLRVLENFILENFNLGPKIRQEKLTKVTKILSISSFYVLIFPNTYIIMMHPIFFFHSFGGFCRTVFTVNEGECRKVLKKNL